MSHYGEYTLRTSRIAMSTVLAAGLVGFAGAPALASGSVDLYNCDDFEFQEDAQATLEQTDDDPNGLDSDDDGSACEDLPSNGGLPGNAAPMDDIILYCSDFDSPEAAQAELDQDPGQADTLDVNGNGVACDSTGETMASNNLDNGQMAMPSGGVDTGAGGTAEDVSGLLATGGLLVAAGAGGLVLLRRRSQA